MYGLKEGDKFKIEPICDLDLSSNSTDVNISPTNWNDYTFEIVTDIPDSLCYVIDVDFNGQKKGFIYLTHDELYFVVQSGAVIHNVIDNEMPKNNPDVCTCSNWTIFHFGCKCGAFEVQQHLKNV